jgi:glutamate carboxypeptidase
MHRYLRYARERLPALTEFVREMVECESPSDSPAHVNALVQLLQKRTGDIARATTFPAQGFGQHLLLDFSSSEAQGDGILGLGHSDTVWPAGALEQMPFREAAGRLWGPGVLDMKGGLAIFIYAIRALREHGVPTRRPVRLLVVSDEEVGSLSSRNLTEAEARRSECVLVLEPGSGISGKLKTARKGVGRYVVKVEGRAAHAGVDPENGVSAILEAARQIEKIGSLNDFASGISVNPGVIRGGTRPNVVAADAFIEVDVRVVRRKDAERIDLMFRDLKPVDPRCRVSVEGGLNRPPMEGSPGITALFETARGIGAEMGLDIEESATGGASDGNFTAALGIPTLDGLGAVGEGMHAENESLFLDRLPERVALVAGLLEHLVSRQKNPGN